MTLGEPPADELAIAIKRLRSRQIMLAAERCLMDFSKQELMESIGFALGQVLHLGPRLIADNRLRGFIGFLVDAVMWRRDDKWALNAFYQILNRGRPGAAEYFGGLPAVKRTLDECFALYRTNVEARRRVNTYVMLKLAFEKLLFPAWMSVGFHLAQVLKRTRTCRGVFEVDLSTGEGKIGRVLFDECCPCVNRTEAAELLIERLEPAAAYAAVLAALKRCRHVLPDEGPHAFLKSAPQVWSVTFYYDDFPPAVKMLKKVEKTSDSNAPDPRPPIRSLRSVTFM